MYSFWVKEKARRSPLMQSLIDVAVCCKAGIRKGRSGKLARTLKVTNSTGVSGYVRPYNF